MRTLGILSSILLLITTAIGPSSKAKAEFLYEPVIISINAPSGKGATVLQFSNPFQKPARIQLSVSEWEPGDANISVKKVKDDPKSILPYIKVSPQQFTLEPGKQKKVRIAVALPPEAPDREYNLFFEMLEIGSDRKIMGGPSENQTLNLSINKQINAGMYLRKNVNKCDLQIPQVSAIRENIVVEEKDKEGKDVKVNKTTLIYKVTYLNSGDVHTRKDIGIRLLDSSGTVILEKKYVDTLIAFPTASRGPITIEKRYTLPEALDPKKVYELEFGFTRSPDQIKGSTCDEQIVKSERFKLE